MCQCVLVYECVCRRYKFVCLCAVWHCQHQFKPQRPPQAQQRTWGRRICRLGWLSSVWPDTITSAGIRLPLLPFHFYMYVYACGGTNRLTLAVCFLLFLFSRLCRRCSCAVLCVCWKSYNFLLLLAVLPLSTLDRAILTLFFYSFVCVCFFFLRIKWTWTS